jgi:hypothetical protein
VKRGLRNRGGLRAAAYTLLAFAAVCAVTSTHAQQATLTADAHVSSARPTVNAGTLSNLDAGGEYTALVQFDLTTLPPGTTAAQITRATLRLYCNRADTPGVITLQTVGGAWTELGLTYTTLPALGAVLQTAQVGAAGTYVTLDVTSAVQAWVSGATANFGLAIAGSGTTQVQFDSKENDQTGHAPELDIALASGGAGSVGATGATGATGAAGPQGDPGPQGLIGPAGATGAPGPQGLAGATGATGAVGPVGPAGSGDGLPGPAGPTGATGATGAPGTNGSAGLQYQGQYSSTTNYALGDVVIFQGSSYASLVAFNVGQTPGLSPLYWGPLTAQGPTGPAGVAGDPGPTGPTGALGPVGPPGEKGDAGPQGVAGQAGAQGIPGVTGATGLSGPAGPQGDAGPVGLSFQGTYNSTVNYGLGDGVTWQGAGWVSLVPSNHGNTPSLSPQQWSLFAAGGPAGATGATGPPGTPGVNGLDGAIGLQGPTGATGATGIAGTPGLVYRGPYISSANYLLGDVVLWQGQSWASLTGFNVGQTPDLSPGYWGVLTSTGPQGPAGPTGAVGPIGLEGQPGQVGPPGPQGSPGPIGIQGPAGMQGLTGVTGPQGSPGPQGLQGTPGQAGAQGVPGITGATGLSGPIGPQGVPGPVGMSFQGPYSSSANYALADGVTWQGSGWVSIVADNHGNTPSLSPSAWQQFSAPGAMGAQGPAGPQGSTGLAGTNGAPGAIGPTGATGVQGQQGVVGPPGPQGSAGPIGIQGPAGMQGLTGPTGAQGSAGPQGLPGVAGQAGAQGVPGTTGAQGLQGPAGVAGPTGAPGATGATGAPGAIGLNFRGTWNTVTHYAVNDAVTFAGSTYLSQTQNTNLEPDMFPSDWTVIAEAGALGLTGPAGTAATLTIGSVMTLPAGASATVTNSGTSQAAVLNFGLPQGATGAPGSGGGSGGGTASGSFAAMYHPVSFNTTFYALNSPNASLNETSGSVLAWVPLGCTAARLDVYSQQSGAITVTLRSGTPGSLTDTPLACSPSTNGSCSVVGSVPIAAGDFLDLRIDHASGTTAGVWTSLQCQ